MALTRPRAHQLLDIDFKQSCRAVTVSEVTLAGGAPLIVDGVTLAQYDRVLVTGQDSNQTQNGIYRVSSPGTGSNGTWVRAADANETGDMTAGLLVTVTEGTAYGDSRWKLETLDPITLGSTNLVFSVASLAAGSNSFSNVGIGGTYLVAEQPGDLLTITAGNNIVTSGNAVTDTATIAVSDNPSFSGNLSATGNLSITGTASLGPTSATAINTTPIGNATPSTGAFTTLSSNSTTTLGLTSATAINSTPIGNATASSGAFTTLSASSTVTFTPANASLTLSPSGTGTVTVNPGTVGSINGMVIGNTNPQSGAFTSLSASSINSTPIGNATPSSGAFTSLTATSINNTPIGNATPSSGVFTTLSATSINSTPIGNATPSSGAFTTLTASGNVTVDTDTFFVDSTNNRIGVKTTTPSYQVHIKNTSANALLVLERTDGASCFIEGQASRSAFGSVGATPLALAYNSLAVVTIGAGGAITVNPDGGSPFTFPTADGSANNVLATNGSGTVSWTGTPSFTTITTSGNASVGGNLTVTGNLTINGTTSTVNSTTVTIDDPIFTLGGDTAPGADDNKDRGIEFRWHNGSAAKVGFFGHDDSTGRFTYIPDATNTSEVFSGTAGDAQFGTVYATATSAQYADLAEYYHADQSYEPGTVVILGGLQEITQSTTHADTRVAGIISTNPAYIMNDSLKGIGLPVALTGRVPCKVLGYAHKGDLMVSSNIPGVAVAWGDSENPPAGSIIGKCLVNKTQVDIDLVEVLVGRY